MPEDYEEFISLTLRTRSSKKPLGMLARNWKHQWLPPCLARHARKARKERPVAKPMRSNQNLRVFWKPVNPHDCAPNYHEDHIAGKGDNSLQHYNFRSQIYPCPQAMKIPAAKAVDKELEKLEKISAWNLTKVEARTSGAKVHFASLMDICHLKNSELETKHQKYKCRVVSEATL